MGENPKSPATFCKSRSKKNAMKKVSISLTFLFTLLFIGCETDSSYPEKEKITIEKPTSTFSLKWLNKKANLKEILSLLNVNSLGEVSSQVYYDNVSNSSKNKNDQTYFVTLTENILLKSEPEQNIKIVILEVNPVTEEAVLVSSVTNNKQEGKMIIVSYSEEIVQGTIFIDYNLDTKYAKITYSDLDSKYYDCMHRRLAAIFEEGTWLDKAEFLLGWPASLLWMMAKCAFE